MKYTCQIDIDLPRDRVIELFDNPDNLSKWQPHLVSFEPVSGVPGQPGAASRLVCQMGTRRVEMIETVTARDLPVEFSATYEAKGVFNTMRNGFEDRGGSTRWTVESEFVFGGMMKIVALFMGGSFKKETVKFLKDFKAFAESHTSTPAEPTGSAVAS